MSRGSEGKAASSERVNVPDSRITPVGHSGKETEIMDINRSTEVYGQITRVVNELKMARQSITIFKVVEITKLDPFVVFQYFYENGLLRGK
jgi:hypothetical protein